MALGRAWALALLLYTAPDFASPLVPGAFVFDAQESVDGLRASRLRDDAGPAPAVPAPGPARLERDTAPVRPTERRPPASPSFSPPRARSAPAAEPRPRTEDH